MNVSQGSATANQRSKPQSMKPNPYDNDTARIRNRLEGGANAAEVASEAYRVYRINAFLRRDIQQAHDEIRKNRTDRQKQAAQEDALKEMRDELPATRQMLERVWGLLGQRKVKIPDDLKADYHALKGKDIHDWQPKKGVKTPKSAEATSKRTEKPKTKAERQKDLVQKRRKAEKTKQTTFLLHTQDGDAYDARKPIVIADESGEEDIPSKSMTAEDAAAIEHADFMKNGSSYRPRTPTPPPIVAARNVVAGVKRMAGDSNLFAAFKKPKVGDDKGAAARLGEVEDIFVPVTESDLEQDTRTGEGA